MDVLKDYSVEFHDHAGKQSLVIDDDGRVAYAYLIAADGEITSDVWLYNRCAPPMEPEWKNQDNMPFANPVDFVMDNLRFSLPTDLSQISVNWLDRDDQIFAQVFVRCSLIAELTKGAKPGWSKFAKKDGPLAKTMERV